MVMKYFFFHVRRLANKSYLVDYFIVLLLPVTDSSSKIMHLLHALQ